MPGNTCQHTCTRVHLQTATPTQTQLERKHKTRRIFFFFSMGNSVKSLKIFTKKVRSARRLFTLWIPWMLLHVWLPDLTESFLTGPVLTEPCAADWVFTNKLSWTVALCVLCGTDTGEDFEIKPASPVVVSAGVRPTPELTVLITVWDFCDLSSPQTHSAWNLRKAPSGAQH